MKFQAHFISKKNHQFFSMNSLLIHERKFSVKFKLTTAKSFYLELILPAAGDIYFELYCQLLTFDIFRGILML